MGPATPSPDGSRIAFVKQQGVWQMGPDGEEPARMFAIPAGQRFGDLKWSPDGRWLTYLRAVGPAAGSVLEAHLPGAADATTILEDPEVRDFCWIAPNRIVLNRWEAPDRPFSNLWEIDVDPRKMKAYGKPRRLTNWAGFTVGAMSASRDGKRVAATKRLDQSGILIGELSHRGDKLVRLRRMNFDDRVEWPGGWSSDSKWLLLQSDRTGNMGIFKLPAGSVIPQPLVTNQDDNWAPLLSADGQWVLYFAWQHSAAQMNTGRLMRLPAGGGSPELVLEARGSPGSVQTSRHVVVPSTNGQPAFRCPSQPGVSCVLSQGATKEVVFQSFAPVPSAARSEIFRIPAKDPDAVSWDVSPDGSRIAWCERELRSASIHVRELGRGVTRDIQFPGWVEFATLGWAADGKSLFVTSWEPAGSSLLHVTLDGGTRVLYKAVKETELPKASPDGRSLAFGEVVSASNVWLIEGLSR